MKSILERLMTKTAKRVSVNMGDGVLYHYNDADPGAKEDAELLKELRQPFGAGKAIASGAVPSVLAALLGGGGSYVLNRMAFDKNHDSAFKQALLTGGASAALTWPIVAALNYGKRVPMENAVAALQGARAAYAGEGPFGDLSKYKPKGTYKVK